MKRAVKDKIKALRRSGNSAIKEDIEKLVLMMISTYFNMDINLCPGSTSEQIYRTAWDQLQTLLGDQKMLLS